MATVDPPLSVMTMPSHTDLNGEEKSFYIKSTGLGFRKSRF